MKKCGILLAVILLLSACGGNVRRGGCAGADFRVPSYFAAGQKLAAFKISAQAYGNRLDGILQIKKMDEDSFDVTLFAAAGGYKLVQAVVTPEGTAYSFLPKMADSAAARAKADAFLRVLLFPPASSARKTCRMKDGLNIVTYKDAVTRRYAYAEPGSAPQYVTYKKTLGSARLNFDQYAPYEEGEIPHYLFYRDGKLEAELALLTLKK